MASTANMYCTGDPDRPPVRCTEPSGYNHTGGEAAFGDGPGMTLFTRTPELALSECPPERPGGDRSAI